MKALFVTGDGDDIEQFGISAWDAFNEPSRRVTFQVWGEKRDAGILTAAKEYQPDVIFYIGANAGPGLPTEATLRELRSYAKTINLCFDATEYEWHVSLKKYKRKECFDLQVATDGAINAPVDMSVVALCDPRYFDTQPAPARDIRCGFPGQIGPGTKRDVIISELVKRQAVTLRQRSLAPYAEYPPFLRRCNIIINVGITGSSKYFHVKARTVEAGLAGACVLELKGSPLDKWFPADSFFYFADVDEAERIIRDTPSDEIARRAAAYSHTVRTEHSPQKKFKEMLARVGL